MSNQNQPGSFTDKQKFEDESSRIDSGFISSEILSEEFQDSGVIEEKKKVGDPRRPEDSGVIEQEGDSETGVSEKQASMLLDSGVCLSENFSKINLSQGQNNFDKSTPVESSVFSSSKTKPQPTNQTSDIPWKIYYEQNEDGDTHLHLSILAGYKDLTLALIRYAPFPDLLDIRNDDLDTPLHLAVATDQWEVARWLIVAGANPCPRDANGDSPLHLAGKANHSRCVDAIAKPVSQQERDRLALKYQGQMYRQCNFDQWNFQGQTCVHVAAMYGNIQVLQQLIYYGANVNAKEGCGGYTALHIGVERSDEALVEFLSRCDKVDLEAVNYRGRTALEVSRVIPSDLVKLLRTKGVPSPYVSDSEDSEESEDELMYENPHQLQVPMVNASA